MKQNTKIHIVKVALALMIITLLAWKGPTPETISIGINIILIIALITYMRAKYPERYMKDERTDKLAAHAASWSWMITFITVTILFWIDYVKYIEFTATQIINIIFWLMLFSIMITRWIIHSKGDIK